MTRDVARGRTKYNVYVYDSWLLVSKLLSGENVEIGHSSPQAMLTTHPLKLATGECRMRRILSLLCLLAAFYTAPTSISAQSLGAGFYDIGSPSITDYFVDPSKGDDGNNGLSASSPKKTVSDVWNTIPQNQNLSRGVRINLLPGSYGSEHLPNYWENRKGTSAAPIILQASSGYGTVFFTRDINMAGVSYFYLIGVDIKNRTSGGYGDAFHGESCDHILLRGNSFNGAPNGRTSGADVAHETIKFNQSRDVYIEGNNIQGADDNGIDFVAVYGGHIRSNRIHDTQGWCMYTKGGSSSLLVDGNIVFDCGEGGITAGQGTGFEFMDAPYLRFEANYIKIVNNVIYNVLGAALGVNGGYNVLIAHNSAYRVGSRSHLIEVVFGERSCDGNVSACQARKDAGGWGPAAIGSDSNQPIGNKNVIIANNVVYNPADFSGAGQHFAIYGPRTPTSSGIPAPQVSDEGLTIVGNIIWNGSSSTPLGIEGTDQGCQSGNATCNAAQLVATNSINTFEPDFVSATTFDLRPSAAGALKSKTSSAISDFSTLDAIAGSIPEGERSNQMVREFSGALTSVRPPGAFVSASSSVDLPAPGTGSGSDPIMSPPGSGGGSGSAPTLKIKKASVGKASGKVKITVEANATDSDGIASVTAMLTAGKKSLGSFSLKSGKKVYSGSKSFKVSAKSVRVSVTARDKTGMSTSKSKTIALP